MIAVDTSTMIAYLEGDEAPDVDAVDRAVIDQQLTFPPVVLCELLSDPHLPDSARSTLLSIPLLATVDGFWERAGMLRAHLVRAGRKARLADTLIAQSCIDHDIVLITRDADFRQFSRQGLALLR